MSRLSVSAVIWERDTPFALTCRSMLFAASTSDLLLIVHEEVNAMAGGEAMEEAEECMRKDPTVKLVHGPEPNFCFVRRESAIELMTLFAQSPPHELRDLIMRFRQTPGNERSVRMLFTGFGKHLHLLPSRTEFARRSEISRRIKEILDGLSEARRGEVLEALGAAALREIRTKDEEWQLQWLVEHLEDDRIAGR